MPGDIYFGITEDGKCLELGDNDKVDSEARQHLRADKAAAM